MLYRLLGQNGTVVVLQADDNVYALSNAGDVMWKFKDGKLVGEKE